MPSLDLSFSEQLLNEVGDISSGDRDVFNAGSDDVSFCHGDDVSHAVTAVDHGASQRSFSDLEKDEGLVRFVKLSPLLITVL